MNHKVISKDDIKRVKTFIAHANVLVEEEAQHKFNDETLEISEVAQAHMADNNEKASYLYSMLTQQANRIMFYLFARNLHTPELEEEYRTLESIETTGGYVQSYADERREAEEAIAKQLEPYENARQGINVFTGILAGKTPKQAKQELEEYNKKMAGER